MVAIRQREAKIKKCGPSPTLPLAVCTNSSLRIQVEVSIKDREKHIICLPKWSWEIPRIMSSKGGARESKNLRRNARRRISERSPEHSCIPWAYFIKPKTFDTHNIVNRTGITLGLFSQPPTDWNVSHNFPIGYVSATIPSSIYQERRGRLKTRSKCRSLLPFG